VLPIADRHVSFAEGVVAELRRAGVRTELDDRSESVGRKIRDAELEKVPFMLVVGDEEERAAGVAVRRHGEGDLGLMPLAEIADRILNAASEHRYTRAR
jgi:threonyl-tRNA synthetase